MHRIEVRTDSSVALGIGCHIEGLGKMRHVALNQCWEQDKAASGEVRLATCMATNPVGQGAQATIADPRGPFWKSPWPPPNRLPEEEGIYDYPDRLCQQVV